MSFWSLALDCGFVDFSSVLFGRFCSSSQLNFKLFVNEEPDLVRFRSFYTEAYDYSSSQRAIYEGDHIPSVQAGELTSSRLRYPLNLKILGTVLDWK